MELWQLSCRKPDSKLVNSLSHTKTAYSQSVYKPGLVPEQRTAVLSVGSRVLTFPATRDGVPERETVDLRHSDECFVDESALLVARSSSDKFHFFPSQPEQLLVNPNCSGSKARRKFSDFGFIHEQLVAHCVCYHHS